MKLTQPAEKFPTNYSVEFFPFGSKNAKTEAAGRGMRLLQILICPYIVQGLVLPSEVPMRANPTAFDSAMMLKERL
jgi:hypothetical protein